MKIFIGIFVVVVLILLYVFVRRPKTQDQVRPTVRRLISSKAETKFHAVSLRFPASACEAAKAMEGRRFLSTAAPRLPLPDCDSLNCKCRFAHHEDRRAGDDRRETHGWGYSGTSSGSYEEEHRKKGERRDDTPDDFFE